MDKKRENEKMKFRSLLKGDEKQNSLIEKIKKD